MMPITMEMSLDELPQYRREVYRPGDPLPVPEYPVEINTWGWPQNRRHYFEQYLQGEYLGSIEDIPDDSSPDLLPLERFDDPRLRRQPTAATESEGIQWAMVNTAKACAGLRHDLRVPGPELRSAIRDSGRLTEKQAYAYRWTLSGIRPELRYTLVAYWGLGIYELARVSALSFSGHLRTTPWLNLWGQDPSKPIPERDGLTMEQRALARGFLATPIGVFDPETRRQIEVRHYEPATPEELAEIPTQPYVVALPGEERGWLVDAIDAHFAVDRVHTETQARERSKNDLLVFSERRFQDQYLPNGSFGPGWVRLPPPATAHHHAGP